MSKDYHPGTLLYDAYDDYETESPKADEKIRTIKADLAVGIDTCIEAAANEFKPEVQNRLLKAASFGKGFVENYPADNVVKMCKTLRLLNAVRHPSVGIPLTYLQYVIFVVAIVV